jgi:anti-sigma-K factor RskA
VTAAESERIACPFCRESIDARAIRCSHCQASLLGWKSLSQRLSFWQITVAVAALVVAAIWIALTHPEWLLR